VKIDKAVYDALSPEEKAAADVILAEAAEALEAYAKAERASGFDPRAGWAGAL